MSTRSKPNESKFYAVGGVSEALLIPGFKETLESVAPHARAAGVVVDRCGFNEAKVVFPPVISPEGGAVQSHTRKESRRTP